MDPDVEEFSNYIKAHPEEVARLKKREGMEEFKANYHVDKASPLKCPACRDMYGGTLWGSTSHHYRFVCRKCKVAFHIDCTSETLENLIARLKEMSKEDSKKEVSK
jgi:transposase-like protein